VGGKPAKLATETLALRQQNHHKRIKFLEVMSFLLHCEHIDENSMATLIGRAGYTPGFATNFKFYQWNTEAQFQ